MDPEEYAAFKAHLNKFEEAHNKCPICGQNNWEVGGPQAFMACAPNGGFVLGGQSIPVVLLVCSTCYFVRTFAWRPFMKEIAGGK